MLPGTDGPEYVHLGDNYVFSGLSKANRVGYWDMIDVDMADAPASQIQMCFDYCTSKEGCKSVKIENWYVDDINRRPVTSHRYYTCELLDIEWTGKEKLMRCHAKCNTYYQVNKGKNKPFLYQVDVILLEFIEFIMII